MTNNKLAVLRQRAELYQLVRNFFAARAVLEVETPLLSHATNPAPHLQSLQLTNGLYLQTSPEFAMKRLLAAGSGDIFQLCKAFRQEELGQRHLPEFTMLEWYRLDFDHWNLMQEVAALLTLIIGPISVEYHSYRDIFNMVLNLDPFTATVTQLMAVATQHQISLTEPLTAIDDWLQLLFTTLIEPQLGQQCLSFIYDFPPAQAMLAEIRDENPAIASRFELYFAGMELANGFQELQDPQQQRMRFLVDLEQRARLCLPTVPLDENFLTALTTLPRCAGVALGIDRLLLIKQQQTTIDQIICYPFTEW